MSYSISIPEGRRYVLMKASGPFTRDLAIETGLKAQALMRANGLVRALYDLRDAPNAEPTTINYYFAQSDLSEMRINRSARVALLVAPDDHSHDFVERAIREAGYTAELFRDEKAALAWLEA